MDPSENTVLYICKITLTYLQRIVHLQTSVKHLYFLIQLSTFEALLFCMTCFPCLVYEAEVKKLGIYIKYSGKNKTKFFHPGHCLIIRLET